MRAKTSTLVMVILSGLALMGCKRNKDKQIPPPQIPVTEVIIKDIPQWMSFVGQTYGKSDIAIQARVNGYLRGLHFKEGGFVRQGDLLYVIEPAPYAAQTAQREASVRQALAQLTQAKQNYDRIKPLTAINAASKSDLDGAMAQFSAAEASLKAAEAALEYTQIEQSYTRVLSPVSGIIGETQARIGDLVGPGSGCTVLNTVSQVDTIRVVFYIPEDNYFALNKHKQMNLEEISLTITDQIAYPQKGRFDFIGRAVEQGTGSLKAQASFPNPDTLLRPGQFARIQSVVDTLHNALLVPQVAVNRTQGVANVYLVDSANRIKQRIVTLGDTYEDLWIITSGLKSGERVVTTGFHKLREGVIIQPVSATDSLKTPEVAP